MEYKRRIVSSKYFEEFYKTLPLSVQNKIIYVFRLLQTEDRISTKFIKHIQGTNGLYEIRVEANKNIYRIFTCFDEDSLIVLFNGFQKKSQQPPLGEIERAKKLMNEYFKIKEKNKDEK